MFQIKPSVSVNNDIVCIGRQKSFIQNQPVSENEAPKVPSPTGKPTNYNQSLKQRINNLVLKTLQENTGINCTSL